MLEKILNNSRKKKLLLSPEMTQNFLNNQTLKYGMEVATSNIPDYILQEQGCCVVGIHSNGLMVTVFATCCMTMNRIITLIVHFLLKIKSVF